MFVGSLVWPASEPLQVYQQWHIGPPIPTFRYSKKLIPVLIPVLMNEIWLVGEALTHCKCTDVTYGSDTLQVYWQWHTASVPVCHCKCTGSDILTAVTHCKCTDSDTLQVYRQWLSRVLRQCSTSTLCSMRWAWLQSICDYLGHGKGGSSTTNVVLVLLVVVTQDFVNRQPVAIILHVGICDHVTNPSTVSHFKVISWLISN